MHLTPDQLNLMFSKKATAEEHASWTDHILDCPACARQFKAMHALHREMQPAQKVRIPFRYAMGVAAVIAMCVYPYLDEPQPTSAHKLAKNSAVTVQEQPPSISLLDRVNEVNYKSAVASWGSETSVNSLIQLSNKQKNP